MYLLQLSAIQTAPVSTQMTIAPGPSVGGFALGYVLVVAGYVYRTLQPPSVMRAVPKVLNWFRRRTESSVPVMRSNLDASQTRISSSGGDLHKAEQEEPRSIGGASLAACSVLPGCSPPGTRLCAVHSSLKYRSCCLRQPLRCTSSYCVSPPF